MHFWVVLPNIPFCMSNVTKHSRMSFLSFMPKNQFLMLVLACRLDLLLLLLFISMLKFFIFWTWFLINFHSYAGSICNFIYFIIQKIALFFLNSVYLRHMSTRLHYSVISLKESFQWINLPMDIISSFPLPKSMKSNQDQRVYQLVKYRQSNSSVLRMTRRSVMNKQVVCIFWIFKRH